MKTLLVSLVCLIGLTLTASADSHSTAAAPTLNPNACISPFNGQPSSVVFCFADPCQVTKSCVQGAKCVSNFCGGCNALFFRGADFVTHCDNSTTCTNPTNGMQDTLVQCFVAPCDNATCPANPSARCFNNYCGGCNAIFFDKGGNRVDCKAVAKQ